MPASQIFRILQWVNADLAIAIGMYEMFVPTAVDCELISRVNAAQIGFGHNVISRALHQSMLTALCRIWDPKNASLPSLEKRLRNETTWNTIVKARSPIQIDPEFRHQLSESVREVSRSEQLIALIGIRNRALAHRSDPNQSLNNNVARPAIYGDERSVLEHTIPIVASLNDLIGYKSIDFERLPTVWNQSSRAFWHCIGRVPT